MSSANTMCVLSTCQKYRYLLRRKIPQAVRWVKPMLFIMLNPSTADAEIDDPTIRSCKRIAEQQGCTSITVVNIFALRSTDPSNLEKASDPVGPNNYAHLREELQRHKRIGIIVAAWGAHPMAEEFRLGTWIDEGTEVFCLGKNKNGSPKHPLFIKSTTPLERYL